MNYNLQDYLQALIYPVILAIPSFLIILLGIGYSIYRYKDFPKVSLLTIFALLIDGFLKIVGLLYPLLSMYLISSGTDAQSISYFYTAFGVIPTIIGVISFSLLIFAVWTTRKQE